MTSSAALSFDALRPWEGAVSRAFEELSYQLLKDQAPPNTRAIRTGNPDGGVEWYATLPDGTEWGWQAKHVHGVDALLTAMTDSVKRVCKERKNLRKLTFAISENLSTGTLEGKRKSQRQKYEDRVASWQKSIKGADNITFELVQGSDLLDILAKPEHQGASGSGGVGSSSVRTGCRLVIKSKPMPQRRSTDPTCRSTCRSRMSWLRWALGRVPLTPSTRFGSESEPRSPR